MSRYLYHPTEHFVTKLEKIRIPEQSWPVLPL